MEQTNHSLQDLFSQLGLPSALPEIEAFAARHRPLPGEIALADATFWSPVQAQFLREEISEDADWAEVVDQLDVMLRA